MAYWTGMSKGDGTDLGSNAHASIAENWAMQTGKRKNGKRMFYEGAKLYSHGIHYVAGVITDTVLDGKRVALVNVTQASKSTTAHLSEARGAANKAGLLVMPSMEPGSNCAATDCSAFLSEASRELGFEHTICLNQQKHWEARRWIDCAKRRARMLVRRDDYAKVRTACAKLKLRIRAGRLASRRTRIKTASAYAGAWAFAMHGETLTRVIRTSGDWGVAFEMSDGRICRARKRVKHRESDRRLPPDMKWVCWIGADANEGFARA